MIHLQVLNKLDESLVSVPVPPPPGALSRTEVSPQLQAKLPVKQTQPSSCPRSPVPANSPHQPTLRRLLRPPGKLSAIVGSPTGRKN